MTLDANELRRLAQAATPGPWKMLPVGDGRQKFAVADSEFLSILTVTDEGGATFGTVYDDADAAFIAAANPQAILELLGRLEAAEAEALEEARLNGMGSEREAALMAKLEAAENDAAHQKALAESALRVAEGWERKCGELRAKIAEMERQEPVAWMLNCPTLGGDTGWILSWTQSGAGLCNRLSGEENEKKLYALPGAKGE